MNRILILIAMFFVAFMNIRVLFCKSHTTKCEIVDDSSQQTEKILQDFRTSDAWSELSAQQLLNLLDQQVEIVDILLACRGNLPKNIEKLELLEHQSMPMVKYVYNTIMNMTAMDSKMTMCKGKIDSKKTNLPAKYRKFYLQEMKKQLTDSFKSVQKMQYEYAIGGMMNVVKTAKKCIVAPTMTAVDVNDITVYDAKKLSQKIEEAQLLSNKKNSQPIALKIIQKILDSK